MTQPRKVYLTATVVAVHGCIFCHVSGIMLSLSRESQSHVCNYNHRKSVSEQDSGQRIALPWQSTDNCETGKIKPSPFIPSSSYYAPAISMHSPLCWHNYLIWALLGRITLRAASTQPLLWLELPEGNWERLYCKCGNGHQKRFPSLLVFLPKKQVFVLFYCL